SSAVQDTCLEGPPLLPSHALELRTVALMLRIAEAEISDKAPRARNIENLAHLEWIENGHPSHADPFRACGEPHRAHCCNHGILDHLRHGLAPKTMPDRGCAIGEHGDLARRLFEARQLECSVTGRLFARIAPQCVHIAVLEIVEHALASAQIVDDRESPR